MVPASNAPAAIAYVGRFSAPELSTAARAERAPRDFPEIGRAHV